MLGQVWKEPKERRKAGPTLMTPAPSFRLAHPSVESMSCGCHGDVKAEALQCWHRPRQQAGPVGPEA